MLRAILTDGLASVNSVIQADIPSGHLVQMGPDGILQGLSTMYELAGELDEALLGYCAHRRINIR